jgi:hypothetical protein
MHNDYKKENWDKKLISEGWIRLVSSVLNLPDIGEDVYVVWHGTIQNTPMRLYNSKETDYPMWTTGIDDSPELSVSQISHWKKIN